jgi:cyclic pyranopterin phosphate synthase
MTAPAPLVDRFARAITYLRLSVTDRCDLRCTYCMPERMTFLPRAEVLSLEELYRLSRAFIERGVTKLRLTGGNPWCGATWSIWCGRSAAIWARVACAN